MPAPVPARRYRFGLFEADAELGELRHKGLRIKLNAQPFQVLCLLLDRPGQLLTRDQIARELWPNGTFVDFEHGLNSSISRIREALGDTASNPRYVETLARRGYRFVAPVERIGSIDHIAPIEAQLAERSPAAPEAASPNPEPFSRFLASPDDLPRTSYSVVQTLFVLLQLMYLGFYVGALANLPEIEDLLSVLPHAAQFYMALLLSAGIMIPVRAFVLNMVLFHAPRVREKFLTLWPLLLLLDILWSLSPFLLLHHISFGFALACTAPLVYSPFAQRSLILMGAGTRPSEAPATAL